MAVPIGFRSLVRGIRDRVDQANPPFTYGDGRLVVERIDPVVFQLLGGRADCSLLGSKAQWVQPGQPVRTAGQRDDGHRNLSMVASVRLPKKISFL